MLGLLAPTLVAVAAGLSLRGSARHLFSVSIRWWPAAVAAFVIELVLYDPPINTQPWALQIGPWLWVISRCVLFAVLARNALACDGTRLAAAWWVAAAGVALNTVVVGVNDGHMPQSGQAALAVWGASHLDASRLQNVVALNPDTRLPWLADVIAEPVWLPRPNVISIGDVLLALGVASWAFMMTQLDRHRSVKVPSRIGVGLQKDG